MSETSASTSSSLLGGGEANHTLRTSHRIAAVRAGVALIWAAALVLAVGDRIPTTSADVPLVAALLLTAYPLIDSISSFAEARSRHGRDPRLLAVNGTVSAFAAAGLAGATFAGDAGTTLAAFGTWAVVSGAIQLAAALRRRRDGDREWPMIISGALSAVAGVAFVSAASQSDANLAVLAGYAAMGALLFLIWAAAGRRQK